MTDTARPQRGDLPQLAAALHDARCDPTSARWTVVIGEALAALAQSTQPLVVEAAPLFVETLDLTPDPEGYLIERSLRAPLVFGRRDLALLSVRDGERIVPLYRRTEDVA